MTSGAEPRSPIGRRKSGREPPLILEFAYIDFTQTRLEAGPTAPRLLIGRIRSGRHVPDPDSRSERPPFALAARCVLLNEPKTARRSVFVGGAGMVVEGER